MWKSPGERKGEEFTEALLRKWIKFYLKKPDEKIYFNLKSLGLLLEKVVFGSVGTYLAPGPKTRVDRKNFQKSSSAS